VADLLRGHRVLRGVDRAAFATALAGRLRDRGLVVGATATGDLTRALAVHPPESRARVYWTARVTLVRRHSDLAEFDAVFAAVFDDAVLALDPAARKAGASRGDRLVTVPKATDDGTEEAALPWATLPRVVGTASDDGTDDGAVVPLRLATDLTSIADVPFEQLSDADLARVDRWLLEALRHWPMRRSRRRRPGPGGRQVALRATLARARRTGFEPVELVRVRPVERPRRVVLLCDVSASMQAQVPVCLLLMRALACSCEGEGFAFATALTRLTPVLRHRSAAAALELAQDRVEDRFGGTRIAASITALLASHHGNAVRGGIVVIASDGWDSEPPEQIARAMARLRRRAHRVVWLNPRAGADGFAPLVGTMAAALPFCDRLLPLDDVASLAAVVSELSSRA
jgi:uncharacterized protein with von Willebrand factor type A (vWA) domain